MIRRSHRLLPALLVLGLTSPAVAAPLITDLALTAATGLEDGYLNYGDVVTATVAFSEAVTVTGTPQLTLTVGATALKASYVSGSGSPTLSFTYKMTLNRNDADGISLPADAVILNGGTIQAGGEAAVLTHAARPDDPRFRVDSQKPAIPTMALTEDTGTVGDRVTAQGAVQVSGLEPDARWGYRADYGAWQDGSGTTFPLLEGAHGYQVRQTDLAGNVSSTGTLVTFTLNPPLPSVPTVTAVALTAATGALNGTLNAGDTVTATVTLSEPVLVTGTPLLTLLLDGTPLTAPYSGGSTTASLRFTATIPAGPADATGISLPADALALNSGTLRDGVGNAAILTHPAVADHPDYRVDTQPPQVTLASDATFLEKGATAALTLTLSEPLADFTVAALTVSGGTLHDFTGSGTTYTATFHPAGGGVPPGRISVASGQLHDAAGNPNPASNALVIDFIPDPDPTPDAFSVPEQVDAPPQTWQTTAPLTLTGFNLPIPVTVSGEGEPQLSLNGGDWGTSGTLHPGQTLALRLTSAADSSAWHRATVEAGGVSGTWAVRTADHTPPTFLQATLDPVTRQIDLALRDPPEAGRQHIDRVWAEVRRPHTGDDWTVTAVTLTPPAGDGPWTAQLQLPDLPSGYYRTRALAEDGAGNRASIDLPDYQHDAEPPVIATATLSAHNRWIDVALTEYPRDTTGQVSGVWVEAETAPGTVETVPAATLTTTAAGDWVARVPLTSVPSGEVTLRVQAVDDTGNAAAPLALGTHWLDNEAPVVTAAVVDAQHRGLTATLSDGPAHGPTTGVSAVWVELATASGPLSMPHTTLTQAGPDQPWSAQVDLSALPSGLHTLRVFGRDPAGNVAAPLALIDTLLDHTPPLITGATLTPYHRQVEATLVEGPAPHARTVTAFWLEATATPSGEVYRLAHQRLLSPGGDGQWLAATDLTTLPSGYYDLQAGARDAVGNEATPYPVATGVLIDTQGPDAALWAWDGAPLQARTIHDLSEILIRPQDDHDPQPTVVSVTLSGGALAAPLPLEFRPTPAPAGLGAADASGLYAVDYPLTQPLLADGDYELTVTVRDAAQQEGVSRATFSYATRWLPLLADLGPHVLLPLLEQPLAIRHTAKHWPLTTDVATASDLPAQPLTGKAALVITLSADAPDGLVVAGQPLNPGQSLWYPDYDFGAAGGRISLPLYPLVTADTGEGAFGTLQIRIDRPRSPVFQAPIHLWSPASQLALTPSAPTYAKKVHKADLWLADAGDLRCQGDFFALREPTTRYPTQAADGQAKCAVRWLDLPPGLKPHATAKRYVTGFLDTQAAEATLRYEIGLFVAQGRENQFIPARPPGAASAIQTYVVPLYEPQQPTLVYQPVSATSRQIDWLPAGVWATRTGKYRPGTIHAQSAPFSGLVLTVSDAATGAVVSQAQSPAKTVRAPVFTDIAAMEGEQQLLARVHYRGYPEIYHEVPLDFVALPQGLVIKLRRPAPANNYTDTVIEGVFGEYAAGDVRYDPVRHGEWTLRLYREYQDANGTQREQLGTDTRAIGPDGTFAINAGPLAAGGHRVLVTATYEGDAVVSENMLKSSVTEVKVFDGTPVACTLSAKPQTAPPGSDISVRVLPADRDRYDDVSAVQWQRSTDGETWASLTLPTGHEAVYGYGETLAAAGRYHYRAVTVNRHSGREAVCPATQVRIFDVPEVTLSGHDYTLLGTAVTWTALVPDAPRPVEYAWTVRRGYADQEPVSLQGATVTLPADVLGSWYVEVRARYLDSPETARAWGVARAALRVDLPRLRPPRLCGENFVEAGRPYAYTAQLTLPWAGYDPAASLVVEGQWELPDGTRVPGTDLTYTPTTAAPQPLRYRAWIRGHQATSETVTALNLRAWTYVFPTASLTQRLVRAAHPTTASFLLALKNGYTNGEPLTTTWTFPEGVTVEQRSDTTVLLTAWEPGEYPLTVQVSDARGNQVQLSDSLRVAEPTPLTLTAKITVGDSWQRAPAPVTVRLYPGGRLPGEQFATAAVRVNGELVQEQVSTAYRLDLPTPGTHTLDFAFRTNYDRPIDYQTTVTLIEGEPPTCTLTTVAQDPALKLLAACAAPMGKIVNYQWRVTFADAPTAPVDWGTRSAYQITLQEDHLRRGVLAVTLVATNDKGETSRPVTWSPVTPGR